MSARYRTLADHVRTLGDDALGELLVELPPPRFHALVDQALARPVVPTPLPVWFVRTPASAQEVSRYRVLTQRHGRLLGWVAHERQAQELPAWHAWTPTGDLVTVDGATGWKCRADAAGALAWVQPASGVRAIALAAFVRALDDLALNDLLVELPRPHFDRLCDAAFDPPAAACPSAGGEAA